MTKLSENPAKLPVGRKRTLQCAFVSSSFGFGPVSKAATIAAEIKDRFPQIETHFFGDGIALDFAAQSNAFDCLIKANVDDAAALEIILPGLKEYETVFSVLNLPLLPLWQKRFGRLYFVDSLAWMWANPPVGVENAEIYFVQDYLVSAERIKQWSDTYPVMLIPPIIAPPESKQTLKPPDERTNRLFVNFSGCSNQYADEKIYEKYAATLTQIIIEEARDKFDEIEICVNQKLADKLKVKFSRSALLIGQLPQEEFLLKLADSRFLLTAPGITTTLEAVALKTPLGFLLPQNDSQAMMSEIYRRRIGQPLTMAFSRFDEALAFPETLDQFESLEQPVILAIGRMQFIIENYQKELRQFVANMMQDAISSGRSDNVRGDPTQSRQRTGQKVLVEKVFE